MEYIIEYFLFFLKFITVILFIGFGMFGFFAILMKYKNSDSSIEIENLNKKYQSTEILLKSNIFGKKQFKELLKNIKKEEKKIAREIDHGLVRKKIFVLFFEGDIKATAVNSLREEITALLTIAKESDEVILILESSGGTVHGYGLAASQLKRIRDKNIFLTVAVDKVAASGGYMMACVANKIISAPFAIVGSIGVLAQIPNFYDWLKRHDINVEQLSAGKYKRTLTLFGENKDEDRQKLQEYLEDIHELFKEFIKDHRPQVDIDSISTGEHWYGKRALSLNLVDELRTSDDYLYLAATTADIYKISLRRSKSLSERLFSLGTRLLNA